VGGGLVDVGLLLHALAHSHDSRSGERSLPCPRQMPGFHTTCPFEAFEAPAGHVKKTPSVLCCPPVGGQLCRLS
jgi:hypothetical protein